MVAQALQHGGLAGAYFARKNDKALAALDAVNQVGQRLFVLRTAERNEGSGLRLNGLAEKTKKRLIHATTTQAYHALQAIIVDKRHIMREVRYQTPHGIRVSRTASKLPFEERTRAISCANSMNTEGFIFLRAMSFRAGIRAGISFRSGLRSN